MRPHYFYLVYTITTFVALHSMDPWRLLALGFEAARTAVRRIFTKTSFPERQSGSWSLASVTCPTSDKADRTGMRTC